MKLQTQKLNYRSGFACGKNKILPLKNKAPFQ